MKGKLYLIPTPLGDSPVDASIPRLHHQTIIGLKHFIVEELRSARRFLRSVDRNLDIDGLLFYVLNEHTSDEESSAYLKPLEEGHDMGLLSETGLPCVADPGSSLVASAHMIGIEVIPLPGPSSIYLALMGSGFNGQQFVFHGYLPRDQRALGQKIRELESEAYHSDRTQIFMEAPYRNDRLFQAILRNCREDTRLCIAANLMQEDQLLKTMKIRDWKRISVSFNRKPAVFLLYP